jgi:hypothetical protein
MNRQCDLLSNIGSTLNNNSITGPKVCGHNWTTTGRFSIYFFVCLSSSFIYTFLFLYFSLLSFSHSLPIPFSFPIFPSPLTLKFSPPLSPSLPSLPLSLFLNSEAFSSRNGEIHCHSAQDKSSQTTNCHKDSSIHN